jgi:hypothetical protein
MLQNTLSSNGNATFVERVRAAELFHEQTVAVIPTYNPDHVTYTDRTVSEYHIDIRWTSSHKGEKTTLVLAQHINKVTRSCTAQYATIVSGKLLPTVFTSLQETCALGPHFCEEIKILSQKFENVCISATKSGQLQKRHMDTFWTM